MLKDLKVSGSKKAYTATVAVEREDESEGPKKENVSAKGSDRQTALANLKMKVVANGTEQQEFDEMAAIVSLEERIDKPTEHPKDRIPSQKVTGYRSEQLEHKFKTPDETTGK